MAEPTAVDCYDSLDGQVALVTGTTRGIGPPSPPASPTGGDGVRRRTGHGRRERVDQRPVRLDVTEEAGRLDAW